MSIFGKLFVVAAMSLSALGGHVQQRELLTNGDFTQGNQSWTFWPTQQTLETLKEGGRSGGCLHIKSGASDEQTLTMAGQKLGGYPSQLPVKLSFWVKGKDVGSAAGIMQGLSKARQIVSFATTQASEPLGGTFDWTHVELVLNPSDEVVDISVMFFVAGRGELWVDDVSLTQADLATLDPAEVDGPGLIEAKGAFTYTAFANVGQTKILIPMMLGYREQAPLNYRFSATPASKLVGTRVYEDRPGNFVAEVTFAPLKEKEEVEVVWTSMNLVGQRSFKSLPEKAPMPTSWPEEAKPWLKSTKCVQSADPKIQKVAKEIRGSENDELKIITATIARAREIRQHQVGQCAGLDAVEALEKQGSCTSNANLVAALLRANGIPARVLSGYPLWSGPLQTHYIVEAYVPNYGWYSMESTLLKEKWQLFNQVVVSIVPPEYEDKSDKRAGGWTGVPYLSLTEYVGSSPAYSRGALDEAKQCDHEAKRIRLLGGSPEQWKEALDLAQQRWSAWLKSKPTNLTMGGDYSKSKSLDEILTLLKAAKD